MAWKNTNPIGNPNIENIAKEKGVFWEKGVSPNPGGKRRGLYKDIAEQLGLPMNRYIGRAHKIRLLEHILDLTENQLKAIRRNPSSPIFLRTLAGSLIEDLKRERIVTITVLWDRVWGRPAQAISMKMDDANESDAEIDNLVNFDEGSLLAYLANEAEDAEVDG